MCYNTEHGSLAAFKVADFPNPFFGNVEVDPIHFALSCDSSSKTLSQARALKGINTALSGQPITEKIAIQYERFHHERILLHL